MKPEILCPRWGKCKAKKKCPLKKVHEESNFEVYVLGECANKDVKVKNPTREWMKAIEKM